MAMHGYSLRSRVNSPATSLRGTPTATPLSKSTLIAAPKPQSSVTLQLDHVIGTTTKNPSGLSACTATNSFAYCAGSVAVLAQVGTESTISKRYYRARPAAVAVNPSTSYYSTPTSTPTRKRRPLVTPRKEQDLTPSRTLPDEEQSKTWTARERIKSVRCVALSKNGKLLAVGETGYNPRVLLFSASRDGSTDVPLSIMTEHTWGVKSVAFSPDSRYLATLGESNDGFLFIWNVNSRTGAVRLCATNKCTSNICHMEWCGHKLITVGTRHVKVWQLPESERTSPSKSSRLSTLLGPSAVGSPTPLSGRNCLLGDMADLTFTDVAVVSDFQAIVSTDIGSMCLVDLSRTPAEFTALRYDCCPAEAVGFRERSQRLVWAGGGGETQETSIEELVKSTRSSVGSDSRPSYGRAGSSRTVPRRSVLRQSLGLSELAQVGIVALTCLANYAITIDANAHLSLLPAYPTEQSQVTTSLSSHHQAVQGIQALDPKLGLGSFFTWSKGGEIRFWAADAQLQRVEQIELDEGSEIEDAASNELKILKCSGNKYFISGDRFGVLKLFRESQWTLLHTARAHSTEINDICVDSASEFVATCSRDRMVQVFRLQESGLDLLQTTDDHIAAVTQVMFSRDDSCLLSSSADRTIVVREKVSRGHGQDMLVAFLQTRIITIKASPLSMCLTPDIDGQLYVSTLDRHVTKIDYTSGTVLDSFKVADVEGDDHAVLNGIQIASNLEMGNVRSILIGCSSTDKSVRIYDLQKQVLMSKESAHTEGVSDLVLLDGTNDYDQTKQRVFVSTGHDSTIMMWSMMVNTQTLLTPAIELTQEQASISYDSDNTPAKPSPATLPPLRKVLTKLDIAEFMKNASPRSPSLRDPSPARQLRRKGSKLALASSTLEEIDENNTPTLRRRASADDRAKEDRRSPSPPAYATKRHKRPSIRGQVTKDFFGRQSEWLRRSPSPDGRTSDASNKLEAKANNSRLRRPPSVPTDLRGRALAQERRASALPTTNEFGSINMSSEQACRMLRTYRKKLESSTEDVDVREIERELELTLETVRKKQVPRRPSAPARQSSLAGTTTRFKLKRSTTSPTTRSPNERKESLSTTDSGANSPASGSIGSKNSDTTEKIQTDAAAGLGVEGLSVLMEKTRLAEEADTFSSGFF